MSPQQHKGQFHAGERAVQRRVFGERVAAAHREEVSNYIRPYMPEQHTLFYAEAPWLVVGTVDAASGFPTASVVNTPVGGRGMTSTQDGVHFEIDRANFLPRDTALANLTQGPKEGEGAAGAPIGILGIQLHTRRRNRVNGHVVASSSTDGGASTAVRFQVDQSFGNCPKYIQARDIRPAAAAAAASDAASVQREESPGLSAAARAVVSGADTFFIATRHSAQEGSHASSVGVDVSHRGGNPGFVRVSSADDEGGADTLTFPDYVGNGFFQTLGNIELDGRVGLLFPDFASGVEGGRLVQVTGRAVVQFDDRSMNGAARTVRVAVESTVVLAGAMAHTFARTPQRSPFNPAVGAAADADAGLTLECTGVRAAGRDALTLTLAATRPIPPFQPGQYGTFRLRDADGEEATRAWTISSTPEDHAYGQREVEITVKRKEGGRVSPWLHGGFLEQSPERPVLRLVGIEGSFVLPAEMDDAARQQASTHLAFVAAGSGVTPVVSILRRLAGSYAERSTATVLYSVRTPADVLLAEDFGALLRAWPGLSLHLTFTGRADGGTRAYERDDLPRALVKAGVGAGRVTAGAVAEVLGEAKSYTVAYVCGPGAFSRTVEDGLAGMANVAKTVTESFDF
eukprot:Rhum_TRINITY_DN8478_c0_g2::Rhum_TRINITY_DN8478_c0_g2_i1::g.28121::m.28121/K07006/K07006; uncharacterized protein